MGVSLNANRNSKVTKVGSLPVDWNMLRLDSLITIKHGFPFQSEFFSDDGKYVVLTPGNFFEDGGFRSRGPLDRHYTGKFPQEYVLDENDLILAMTEQAHGLLGSPALVPVGDKYLHNQRLGLVMIRNPKALSKSFLFYLMSMSTTRKQIFVSAGGTKVKHTSPTKIGETSVPIPPLPEQKKIAELLTTWDGAIGKMEELIKEKERRKKALMQQLLSGRKRFRESAGESWQTVRLGDVACNRSERNSIGLPTEKLYAVTKVEGMLPMREHVKGSSFERCKIVEPDSFAYNPMRLNIGSIAQWEGHEAVMVSPDYVVFSTLGGKLDPRYLEHLRKTALWIHYVNNAGNGSVRVRLYFKDIAAFRFTLPGITEQRRIADLLDACSDEISAWARQLETLKDQKKGLMQKLLTGEVRVTHLIEQGVPA